jgi:hypothetical protein
MEFQNGLEAVDTLRSGRHRGGVQRGLAVKQRLRPRTQPYAFASQNFFRNVKAKVAEAETLPPASEVFHYYEAPERQLTKR